VPLDVRADGRLLAFASLIAVLTGVVFGLIPVWRYRLRPEVALTVSRSSRPRLAVGRGLVIVQVALSLVLVAGALLFVRTLQNLRGLDAGFTRQRVLLAQINPMATGYSGPQLAVLNERLRTEIARIPGVQSISQSGIGLMTGRSRICCFAIPGYTPAADERMALRTNDVTPSYFATVGMTMVEGRTFTEADTMSKPRPLIVNETLVRKYFGGKSPIGQSLALGSSRNPIVGVVADARYDGLRLPTEPLVFWPARGDGPMQSIEVRAVSDSRSIAAGVRRAIAAVDPRLPLHEVYTVEQLLDSALAQERLMARLSGFFGALVLVLACVGIYGLLAQLVARRTNEIGIRMALGAQGRQITTLVLRETALLVVPGLLLGLAAAFATTRLAAALLFEISPTDPASMILAPLCLTLAALAAAWLPARRAATITPLTALRQE
jgi:predicted permease